MTATVKLKDSDETAMMQHQSILAKLLSKENIKIRHGNYTTAFFELKTRTLGLPRWANKGKDVYDLLIGHEVGHALYTPQDAITLFNEALPNIPFDVCNIVEDIRIERMIQDTYPGLTTVFRKAYARLVADDFFGTAKADISKMKFIDRLNLHAKVGPALNIPFSSEELAIYDRCFKAQTFAEVLEICKDIKDLAAKNEKESKPKPQAVDADAMKSKSKGISQSDDSDDSDKDSGDASAEGKVDESQEESYEPSITPPTEPTAASEETPEAKSGQSAQQEFASSPFISKTLESYENSLEAIAQTNSATAYFTVPSLESIRNRIIPFTTLMAARGDIKTPEVIEAVKIKRRKAVKYAAKLVREFERRKAAFQYSRATVARHGVIDVNRLHAYKTCDDIFSSSIKLADSKSHGMMMFIDYSGSMEVNLGATLEHLANLVLFCRAIGVPFNVYAFTNSPFPSSSAGFNKPEDSEISLADTVFLELFSSKMSKAQFKLALTQILAQAAIMTPSSTLFVSPAGRRIAKDRIFSKYETLNDTPLIETVVAAHVLVAEFQKATNVQKMNVIFLTDGSGSFGIKLNGCLKQSYDAPVRKLTGILNRKAITFDRDESIDASYAKLIKHLRETTNSTTLGFFIPSSKKNAEHAARKSINFNNVQSRYIAPDASMPALAVVSPKSRCEDSFVIKDGYNFNEYYILPPALGIYEKMDDTALYDDFVPVEDVAKNKRDLSKLFLNLNLKSKSSQVILNKFSQMIA